MRGCQVLPVLLSKQKSYSSGFRAAAQSLRAGLTEEAGDPGDISAVDESVHRVGRDVIAGGGRRDGLAEVTGDAGDVCAVREGIVVEVGGPGVIAAVPQRVCPGAIFDG